jgi:phosphatidylglycerophosphatase A
MSKKLPRPLSFSLLKNPLLFLAFGFGSGLSRVAPGTVGTLVAIPPLLLFQHLSIEHYVLVLLISFGLGILLCGYATNTLGVHDHPGIVWDEMVGFWLTMFIAPPSMFWIVAGFIFFRLFDIWKPFPIGYLDKHLRGGLGIMLDDVLAACYAWLCLQVLRSVMGDLPGNLLNF